MRKGLDEDGFRCPYCKGRNTNTLDEKYNECHDCGKLFFPKFKLFRVHFKDHKTGIEGAKELTAVDEDNARDIFSETTPADEILDVEEVE